MNNTSVESYLSEGCGRCARFRTPSCKVHAWAETLVALRALLRATELDETMKWGAPCYTLGGKNVVLLGAFNDACVLSFFKGALLRDERGLLSVPGPNARIGRTLRFAGADEVRSLRAEILGFVAQAIALERAGVKIPRGQVEEPLPAALAGRLAEDEALRRAFEALTPGRRRSHALYVGAAKGAETQVRRVERCVGAILAGRGFQER
jgi:uncharacterized protein YdeI (YjbR/CyaY-like superfamily)